MGGPKIDGGMSYEERQALLRDEQRMAEEREEHQREILALEEAQREARDRAQRLMREQEESQRLAEIERLEQEGAEVSEDIAEAVDEDTAAADMWTALAMGTQTEERPE